MQLMGDAISVLGSRIGLAWDPANRRSYVIRCSPHPGVPVEIQAGVSFGGETLVFPLCADGQTFAFMDQEMTPTSMRMVGIDPQTGLHVTLTIRVPFRPRDAAFSTVPAIFMELTVVRLPSRFRWHRMTTDEIEGQIFIRFLAEGLNLTFTGDSASVCFTDEILHADATGLNPTPEAVEYADRLAIISGEWNGKGVSARFNLKPGVGGGRVILAWCAYDQPILEVLGDRCPFRYASSFGSVEEVARWAHVNAEAVADTSRRVDGIITGHNLGTAVSHLLSQTLHSWLINTWWVTRSDGREWFSVWEGSGYFQSSLDVEFTQAPFYLTVWPELLEMELHQWPLMAKDGTASLGERGAGTLFATHDLGQYCECSRQGLWLEMELEETADYILLAYAHWRRTGNDTVVLNQADHIKRLLDFLVACDITGNGVPDYSFANTIDDGPAAVQYAPESIYIAVKALVACRTGSEMLAYAGRHDLGRYLAFAETALATIERDGWREDHYVTSLSRSLDGVVNPWTGQVMRGALEGWDASHIYTPNGLAILDMVNYDCGLADDRLRKDMETAMRATLGRYGCRHTSYRRPGAADFSYSIPSMSAPDVGWISMNMLRDIAAAYRGIDCLAMAERYWDWQCTANSQELKLFFETFYGNDLYYYPRGAAVYGYLDAAVGFRLDRVTGVTGISPIRASLVVPLLALADWTTGRVPLVRTWLEDGKIKHERELREPVADP